MCDPGAARAVGDPDDGADRPRRCDDCVLDDAAATMANIPMTVEIKSTGTGSSQDGSRDVMTAMMDGFRHRCPSCQSGPLYESYLKVTDTCTNCGTELHHHRADDAPPYFTIFLVGHFIVGGVLALERAFAPEAWVHAAIWVPLTLVLSLLFLPRVKGALVGLQWALRMHGFGSGRDPADPDPIAPSPTSS